MNAHTFGNQGLRFWGITLLGFFLIYLLLVMPSEALRLKTIWAERVDLSEKVIRGQVVGVNSYWNLEKNLIYTDVVVLIDEYLKGDGLKEITITLPGGTVGDETQWVSDVPHFDVGDYGAILLESSGQVTNGPDGVYPLQKPAVGADQLQRAAEGKFLSWIRSYVNGQTNVSFEELPNETTGQPMQQETSYATITGVSPSTVSAGTGDVVTITGSGFGASRGMDTVPRIAFKYKYINPTSFYMANNSKIISWSDTEIKTDVFTMIINSYHYSPGSWDDTIAFINSSSIFEYKFPLRVTFGYGSRKWAVSPVSYYINPTGGPTGTETAIQAAANTWSETGANFSFSYAGPTSSGYGYDGLNVISFDNLASSTIIGRAIIYSTGSTINEADIQFNTNFDWSIITPTPNNKMDVQSVVLHELGHWLKLLDLYGEYDSVKAMYGYGAYGQMKRTLTSEDQQGIQRIYPDYVPPDTTITGGPTGDIYTNSATFTFTGTHNSTSTDNLEYATYLQGYDSGWSSFSSSTTKYYSSLPYGSYTFQVKARDQAGNEDPSPATRSFILKAPFILQTPNNNAVFDLCSLINKHQPSFEWTADKAFTKFTVLFSISPTDFSTPIAKAMLQGKKLSWTPPFGTWKKLLTSSYTLGTTQSIYWKVIGTNQNKIAVESEVRSFRVEFLRAVTIITPSNQAVLSSGTPPTFELDTTCNTKFRIEFSSLESFGNPSKIKGFIFTAKEPGVQAPLQKTLKPGQWNAVKKLVGTATGYFRIRAWDGIKRETVSEVSSFTVQ